MLVLLYILEFISVARKAKLTNKQNLCPFRKKKILRKTNGLFA